MLWQQLVFWISLSGLIYSYCVFPLVVCLLAKRKNANANVYQISEELPQVSVLIPVYNEATVIASKLNSVLGSNYPAQCLEVIVGSDASTDETGSIVAEFSERFSNVHLLSLAKRAGKASVMNALAARARSPIIVFTDADILFDPATIFELVKHFQNKDIGLVACNVTHKRVLGTGGAESELKYISHEMKVKSAEGKVFGMMMGPFGNYAMRAELFVTVPPHFLCDDFFVNMHVMWKSYESIVSETAIVFEDLLHAPKEEFRRKIRIGAGNYQNLLAFLPVLLRFDALSLCFLSHKVLRWLGPFFLLLCWLSSSLLLHTSWIYVTALAGLTSVFCSPLFDAALARLHIRIAPVQLASHFSMANLALVLGFFKCVTGIESGIWQPTARPSDSADADQEQVHIHHSGRN